MNSGARSWRLERQEGLAGTLPAYARAIFRVLAGAPATRLVAELDGARRLRVVGPLDKRVARALKAQAREFVSLSAGPWTIDLAKVSAWDGDGLASLVYALDLSELNGHVLTLAAPNPVLRATLERAQLHHLFPIH